MNKDPPRPIGVFQFLASAFNCEISEITDRTLLCDFDFDSIKLTALIANLEVLSPRLVSDEDALAIMKASSVGELVEVLQRYID